MNQKQSLFSISDICIQARDIYRDQIEEFTLVCTPLTMNGIHLLDRKAMRILDLYNEPISIRDIIQRTKYSKKYAFGVLDVLWRNKLIKVNDALFSQTTKNVNSLARIETWFHITNRCNLACPYCYIKKTKESMSREIAFLSVDNLIESALRYNIPAVRIKFTGGEPLLRFPMIKEVVSYGKKRSQEKNIKISFHLLTNGTCISEEVARYLKKENISISLSVDGIAEYHDILRHYANGTGTFQKVEKALFLLGDFGIYPYILTTVSALNLYGLPDLTRYLLEKKLSFRFSLYRELNTPEESLRSYNDEVIRILHQCYDIFEKNLPDRDFFSLHQLCDIKLTKSRKRVCGIGTKGVSIDHKGRIAICQAVFDNPVGHISHDDALTAIRSQDQFRADHYSIDNYEYCGSCYWRYTCNGGCPMLTKLQYGTFNTRSPYCEVFKKCIPRLIRIAGLQIVRDYRKNLQLKGGV